MAHQEAHPGQFGALLDLGEMRLCRVGRVVLGSNDVTVDVDDQVDNNNEILC